ncbi:hypothetical protein RUM44_003523 [Polyplax serrata]|uniref:Uncharacterized protein n=1 Tax=Polyplax serrata TaxID=468196 RepID=A0ABR1AGQ5_POLSC
MNKDELLKDFDAEDRCEPQRKDIYKWDVYGKNQYCPVIKVTNWWYHREGFPKDSDDYTSAAYKRWGTTPEGKWHWTTETMDSLEAGKGDPALNKLKQRGKHKTLLSFLSYPITL